MAAATTAPAAKPLVQLISRFSLLDAHDEGAPEGSVAYLEKLAEVLEDGVLDPAEATSLADVAATYDLTVGHVDAAHLAFVRALAQEAMADGKLTRAERTELTGVASALDLPATAISAVLADATSHHHARRAAGLAPLPDDWSHGEPLRVGDRIVFTGCDFGVRERLEQQSEAAGVRVMNGVARTTAMLITDGSSAGTKTRKAAELGTRVVEPDTYRYLLQHLQPAAARDAPPSDARAPKGATTQPPDMPAPVRAHPIDRPPGPTPAELRALGSQQRLGPRTTGSTTRGAPGSLRSRPPQLTPPAD